ncbi:DNA methylase N-4, partial [Candidatus Shapirobacteria bacterium CG09_land_8_20_14_0_10_39_12]
IEIDYEFILLFKKLGQSPNKVNKEIKEESKLSNEEWRKYFTGHWNFAGCKQDKHIAMFPDELPRRLIKMFSFIDETVLDPFLGSGTTSRVARKLKRNSIGYEINKDFLPIIEDKIGKNKPSLFDQRDVIEVIYQNDKKENSNHLVKIGENNKTINNRIRHPEYWKTLKTQSF